MFDWEKFAFHRKEWAFFLEEADAHGHMEKILQRPYIKTLSVSASHHFLWVWHLYMEHPCYKSRLDANQIVKGSILIQHPFLSI